MYLSLSTLSKTSGYFFHLWIEKQDITAFKGTNASWGSYITEFVGQYCEGVNDKDRRRAAGARERKKRKFWSDGELRQEKWGWWKKGDIWGKVQNSRQQREEEKEEGSGGDFCFFFLCMGSEEYEEEMEWEWQDCDCWTKQRHIPVWPRFNDSSVCVRGLVPLTLSVQLTTFFSLHTAQSNIGHWNWGANLLCFGFWPYYHHYDLSIYIFIWFS